MSYTPYKLVLLSSKSASSSASIAFTSTISSFYSSYFVRIRSVVPATNDKKLQMLWSTNNGSTYIGSGYQWGFRYAYAGSTGGRVGNASDSTIVINDFIDNGSGANANFDIQLFNMNQASKWPTCLTKGTVLNGGLLLSQNGFGGLASSNQINAIKLQMSAGNITSGNFYFYGVVEP